MVNIAVFASGRGSNFQTIYHKTVAGYLPAKIAALISDNRAAGAIEFAREQRIPVFVAPPGDFPSPEVFGGELLRILKLQAVEFIVLAGYLKKIPANVVDAFPNRILNIHPALLPSFGGKGMYGMRVHQAVFDAGVKVSGVTVHLVNNEYDAGPIVLQRAVDIRECRSPEEIARKVLAQEHRAFPEALKLLLENEYRVEGRRVIIRKIKHDPH